MKTLRDEGISRDSIETKSLQSGADLKNALRATISKQNQLEFYIKTI